MAGQIVTVTEQVAQSVKLIKWAWTSATGGTVSQVTTEAFDGKLIVLVTDPGGTAPDDNYNVTVTDSNGLDVLAGKGLLRDTANTETVTEADLGAVANSVLTLVIDSAGDVKTGDVYLYIR